MGAAANPSSSGAAGFYITVTTLKGSTTKKIEGDKLSVGRASDCDLAIQHDTLSRRHMTVTIKNGQCFVEDHGSSNGTFLNGKRLTPHQPVSIQPEDFVHLGQSGVRISASIEPQMWKGATPTTPAEAKKVPEDTIVTSTAIQRGLKAVAAEPVRPDAKRMEEAQEQAEQLVQDAQKRATNMIQEAELDAERRVQDIYRRAHETQAKNDEIYQRRMNEAYRAAEKMYQKSQAESEAILDQARTRSHEIRAQAESFVMELRARTEQDCERLLQDAQATARELKENRLLEAEEFIRKKEDEVIRQAKESMATRLARFEEDLQKESTRQRQELEKEVRDRRDGLEHDTKEQVEQIKKLKAEAKALAEARDSELAKVKELEKATSALEAKRKKLAEETSGMAKIAADHDRNLAKSVADANEALAKIKTEMSATTKSRDESKAVLAKIHGEIESMTSARDEAKKGLDAELLKLRAKFEEDKAKLEKAELEHLEQLKLDTSRKIRAVEDELMRELEGKRERLSREIGFTIENLIKDKGDSLNARVLTEEVEKLIGGQIVTLSQDPAAKTKQKSLVSMRRREKVKTVFVSLLIGGMVGLGGQEAYHHVQVAQMPMQAKVDAAAEARKLDLERRKFAPPQVKELKPTYMDAVIYTERFTETYGNEDFQRKFQSELTPYLLKTWRIEEEKVIQLLALTTTTVKALAERKEAIHPDFIPQGLEKMKELDDETLTRMRDLLGTQVKVESFKKFERKFYEKYIEDRG